MTLLFLLAMNLASAPTPQRAHACAIAIVTYRIAATPGTSIRYAGDDYTVGSSGSIEIIADATEASLISAGSVFNFPHNGPTDAFGSVTVSVMPQSEGALPMIKPRRTSPRAAR
jgi:hypothetical protein